MRIKEIYEAVSKKILVIYPGRFQPFHKGHYAVYQHLCEKYGEGNVVVVTSNKVDPPRSPFDFGEKMTMMTLTGVNSNAIVQDAQPYQAKELVAKYDPDSTILIFAVSEKDMAEDPRFQFKPKKDGSPSYFQRLPDQLNKAKPLKYHGYIATVPTFNFEVLGQPANSATQIRAQFANADEATQKAIVTDLFGKFSTSVLNIMQRKLIIQIESIYTDLVTMPASDLQQINKTLTEINNVALTGNNKKPYELLKQLNTYINIIPNQRSDQLTESILTIFNRAIKCAAQLQVENFEKAVLLSDNSQVFHPTNAQKAHHTVKEAIDAETNDKRQLLYRTNTVISGFPKGTKVRRVSGSNRMYEVMQDGKVIKVIPLSLTQITPILISGNLIDGEVKNTNITLPINSVRESTTSSKVYYFINVDNLLTKDPNLSSAHLKAKGLRCTQTGEWFLPTDTENENKTLFLSQLKHIENICQTKAKRWHPKAK
jgi:cytidyltransferase-like protein